MDSTEAAMAAFLVGVLVGYLFAAILQVIREVLLYFRDKNGR
jgi:hypothetical protein